MREGAGYKTHAEHEAQKRLASNPHHLTMASRPDTSFPTDLDPWAHTANNEPYFPMRRAICMEPYADSEVGHSQEDHRPSVSEHEFISTDTGEVEVNNIVDGESVNDGEGIEEVLIDDEVSVEEMTVCSQRPAADHI